MSRALIVLDSESQRRKAAEWCWALKDGTRCEFKGPKRTLDQNSLFWVLLTEIATQLKWHGQKLTPDDWKLLMLDALRRAKREELHFVPNLDSTGFVSLSASSSDLSKEEMSELIELIYAFGAKHDVAFHQAKPEADNQNTNSPGMVLGDPAGHVLESHAGGQPSEPDTSSQADQSGGPVSAPLTHADGGRAEHPSPAPAIGTAATNSTGDREPDDSSGAIEPASRTGGTVAPIPGHSEPRGSATASDGPRVADEASSEPAPDASAPLSDEDREWLVIGARMLVACQPDKSQEARMVLNAQVKGIQAVTPKTIGKDARRRLDVIRLHCVAVCRGEVELDMELIAKTALATVADVTPKPVKVRSA